MKAAATGEGVQEGLGRGHAFEHGGERDGFLRFGEFK